MLIFFKSPHYILIYIRQYIPILSSCYPVVAEVNLKSTILSQKIIWSSHIAFPT